jgi:hypothetical protein
MVSDMPRVIVGSDDLYPCAREAVEYLKRRGLRY